METNLRRSSTKAIKTPFKEAEDQTQKLLFQSIYYSRHTHIKAGFKIDFDTRLNRVKIKISRIVAKSINLSRRASHL